MAATPPNAEQAFKHAKAKAKLVVGDYLTISQFVIGRPLSCSWRVGESGALAHLDQAALAWVIADAIMRSRFGSAVSHHQAWRTAALSGQPLSGNERQIVEAFVDTAFGLPATPKSVDHLEGHVAEWVWFLLVGADPGIELISEPKTAPTDGGSDGVVLYRTPGGDLRFTLWEIKKHTSGSPAMSTIRKACVQLAGEGNRYVAMFIGAQQGLPADQELLVANMADHWVEGNACAGAGVAVASAAAAPAKPFKQLAKKLPRFDKADQLVGLFGSLPDFAALSQDVRRFVWSAL